MDNRNCSPERDASLTDLTGIKGYCHAQTAASPLCTGSSSGPSSAFLRMLAKLRLQRMSKHTSPATGADPEGEIHQQGRMLSMACSMEGLSFHQVRTS